MTPSTFTQLTEAPNEAAEADRPEVVIHVCNPDDRSLFLDVTVRAHLAAPVRSLDDVELDLNGDQYWDISYGYAGGGDADGRLIITNPEGDEGPYDVTDKVLAALQKPGKVRFGFSPQDE